MDAENGCELQTGQCSHERLRICIRSGILRMVEVWTDQPKTAESEPIALVFQGSISLV